MDQQGEVTSLDPPPPEPQRCTVHPFSAAPLFCANDASRGRDLLSHCRDSGTVTPSFCTRNIQEGASGSRKNHRALSHSTIFDACKKHKQQIKAYAFHVFADPGCPVNYSGLFRDNIRSFLQECAEIEDYNVEGMPTWCTLLINESSGVVVPLYFIEENVKHSS